MKKLSEKEYLYLLVFIVSLLVSFYLGYFIGEKNKSENIYSSNSINKINTITPTIALSSTPTPTIQPSETPIAVLPTPKPKLIALHIDAMDYSEGHPGGLVTENVKVQLFNMDGSLIEEKTPSPYVQNGPVGTGGDTIFYVLPSTYKIIASTPNTSGSCIAIVRTTNEYNSCGIYMVKK